MIDEQVLQFDYEWREGSRSKAIEIAKLYIESVRPVLQPVLSKYTLDELVKEVEALRACGAERHHDRIITDMWILSEYPLGNITGVAHVTVKIPDFKGENYVGV